MFFREKFWRDHFSFLRSYFARHWQINIRITIQRIGTLTFEKLCLPIIKENFTRLEACEKSSLLELKQIIGHKSSSSFFSFLVLPSERLSPLYFRLDWGQIEFDNLFLLLIFFLSLRTEERAEKFHFAKKKNVFLIHKSRDNFSF